MQDDPTGGWTQPRDVSGLLDTLQRVMTQQNEAWMRVLRKATAGGYTPRDWVADMSDMAQQWYSEVKDHLPRPPSGGGESPLPTLQFDLDRQAESADAKHMMLPRTLGSSKAQATPLRSLNDVPVPQGPRVTVQSSAGESRVLIGLAGMRKLKAGRYVSAIEDDLGRILGVVLVTRA